MSSMIPKNKNFRLRTTANLAIVTPDGEIPLGMVEPGSFGARQESTSSEYEAIYSGRRRVIHRKPTGEKASLDFSLHDYLSPEIQQFFLGQGATQTITTSEDIETLSIMTSLFGTEKQRLAIPAGIISALTYVAKPTVDSTAGADSGGSIADGTFYVWVVPVFNQMPEGYTRQTFSLANYGNCEHGVDFWWGEPSDDSSGYAGKEVTVSGGGGSGSITANWTIGTTCIRPDYWAIVVGTADDITDGSSHVAAAVAGNLSTATVTALGTEDFGASVPTASSYIHVEELTKSGDDRQFTTTYTRDTDYTFTASTGEICRIAGGSIDDGEPLRISIPWRKESSVATPFGGSIKTSWEMPLRAYLLDADSQTAASAAAVGAIIDFYEIDFAGFPVDLVTRGTDHHNPLPVSLTANYDEAESAIGKVTVISGDLSQYVDFYGPDVT